MRDKLSIARCLEQDVDSFITELNDYTLLITDDTHNLYTKINGERVHLATGSSLFRLDQPILKDISIYATNPKSLPIEKDRMYGIIGGLDNTYRLCDLSEYTGELVGILDSETPVDGNKYVLRIVTVLKVFADTEAEMELYKPVYIGKYKGNIISVVNPEKLEKTFGIAGAVTTITTNKKIGLYTFNSFLLQSTYFSRVYVDKDLINQLIRLLLSGYYTKEEIESKDTEIKDRITSEVNRLFNLITTANEKITTNKEKIEGLEVKMLNTYNRTEIDGKLLNKADKVNTYTKDEVDYKIAQLDPEIRDVYIKEEVDNLLALKSDKATTYTKTEVDDKIANIDLTTLDVYKKEEINTMMGTKVDKDSVYTKDLTYNKDQVDTGLTLKADKTDVYAKTETYSKQEVDDKVAGAGGGSGLDKATGWISKNGDDTYTIKPTPSQFVSFVDQSKSNVTVAVSTGDEHKIMLNSAGGGAVTPPQVDGLSGYYKDGTLKEIKPSTLGIKASSGPSNLVTNYNDKLCQVNWVADSYTIEGKTPGSNLIFKTNNLDELRLGGLPSGAGTGLGLYPSGKPQDNIALTIKSDGAYIKKGWNEAKRILTTDDQAGGGGGASVTKFELDSANNYLLNLETSDGTKKTVNLKTPMLRYNTGYGLYTVDYLTDKWDNYLWKIRLVLGAENFIPLKIWKVSRQVKNGCTVHTDTNGVDYLRFPEGDIEFTMRVDTASRWRPLGEENPTPNSGIFTRRFGYYYRKAGDTSDTWKKGSETEYKWSDSYPWVSCTLNIRGSFSGSLPSYPCDVKFYFKYTTYGNTPTDILNNDLRIGIDNYPVTPGYETSQGLSLSTKPLIRDSWVEYSKS